MGLRRLLLGSLTIASALSLTIASAATNVSGQVKVTNTGFGVNRATGLWSATMTVTNASAAPISGPIEVVLTSLSSNATMVNNTGVSGGSPFILVSSAALAPGAAVTVAIQFTNPTSGFINFTPVTYSGTLGPAITDFNPKTGPIGTLVTVSGSLFGTAPQVTLAQLGGGNISPPVTASSTTSLSFVIPAGATTGLFTISTGGTNVTSPSSLMVTPSTSFSITATPTTANLIQGQSVAFAIQMTSTNGFNQLAPLAVSGVPSGVTATFKPRSLTAGQTAVLTLTAPANQAAGKATLSISASATVDGISSASNAGASLSVVAPSTTLLGRTVVTDALETPLAGVTITTLGLDGNGNTTGCTGHSAVSDGAGNFVLTKLPMQCTGPQLVSFNGNTVTAPPGKYDGVSLIFTLASGQVTAAPVLVHLPRIDNAETFLVQQNSATNQSHAFTSIPGLTVTVYAGTTFTMADGTRPNPFPLSAVQVPTDRLPDAKPNVPTMIASLFVSFQPFSTTASQPVAVYYPNTLNTPPGIDMAMMTLDPTHGTMVPYGTGTVSANGTQVVPDADPAHPGHLYGLVHFDWHGVMPPPAVQINPSDCEKKKAGSSPQCGKPIDISSGIDTIEDSDLTLSGTRGGIEFTRILRTATSVAGPFGIGGDHSYDLLLDTFSLASAPSFNLVMPDGRRIPFVRQANGTLINTVNPSMQGSVISTAAGDTATLRLKSGVIYNFESFSVPSNTFGALLTSIIDPNGNTITLTRNSAAVGQITVISDPVGRLLSINYDGAGRITSITDPIGRTVSYTYNAAGYLATFTDANAGVSQYGYDGSGNLITVTDPRGVVTERNTFDANGRVISQVQADGNTIQLSYVLTNPLAPTSPVMSAVETDQLGRQTTYRFNPQGFVVQVTDAAGQSRVFNRQPGNNLLLGLTGPGTCGVCGDTTAGDMSYTYDANGNQLTSADSLGNTFTYTYDPTFSNVTSATDPTGAVARYQYDANGNLTAFIDQRGNQTTIAIGTFGLPASITDATNQTTALQYDGTGNLISIRDPLSNTTTFAYDAVSRRTQVTDPLGAQFSSTWDPLDRLVAQTDALGGITRYAYDAIDDLLSLTDPRGGQTTYTYDALARATKRVDPLNRQEVYGYDPVSNLTSYTDRRGQTSAFSYDSLDRVITQAYSDATVSRSYDANGRQQQVNDSQGGEYTYQYDSAGRLLHSVAPQGAIAYTRDGLGRATLRQVTGQQQVTYQYDPDGNLTQAAMPQASVSMSMSYDARNSLLTQNRSNGVSSGFTYDPLARVLSIAHQAGSNVLANFSYAYDAAGNRAGTTSNLAQALTTPATTGTFDAADEMSSFGGRTFTYDANGNRLSDVGSGGTNSYSWDGRNRLQSITQPNGTVIRFTYDFGRNLTQQAVTAGGSTTTTSYLVDGITNVVAIYGGSTGTLSLLTGSGVDDHLATINSLGQAQFALDDALGTVAANSGSSASLDGRSLYEPFGQTISTGASFPFAFTGRVPMTSAIYYYRARFYDSTTGRFLSEDPIGFFGRDDNLYRYVGNHPTMGTDPQGKEAGSNSDNIFTRELGCPRRVHAFPTFTGAQAAAQVQMVFNNADSAKSSADMPTKEEDAHYRALEVQTVLQLTGRQK